MKQFQRTIDEWTDNYDIVTRGFKDVFVSTVSLLSLIAAPLSPAITFGFALFNYIKDTIGFNGAVMSGVALAIALEGVGIISAKVALDTYDEYDRNETGIEKLLASVSLVFLYLLIGVLAVWFFDSSLEFRVIGTLSFLIALLIYSSHALLTGNRNKDKRVQQSIESNQSKLNLAKQDREHQRETELRLKQLEIEKQTELQLQLKQMELQSKTEIQLARIQSKSISVKLNQSNGVRQHKRQVFIDYVKSNPDCTNNVAQMTRELGFSRVTVDKWLDEYQSNGMFVISQENGMKRIAVNE